MATKIATLAVKLTASAGAFSTTMAGAGKQLAGFGSSITSIGSKVLGFGGALTAIAAGGSLIYLTKQSLDAIDANAKLSDRLGLSTEALTGLQYAGDLAGVSSEQLTGGLEKMLKSLGGAADDSELASNAFTKLGLSAADLANVPADEAFSTIAQKISEIQNPAERAAAAVGIFGKAGQSLLPLMMSGAEGIKAAEEEAKKLGLTYSRVDAAAIEQSNDSWTRAGKVFEGITNQIAIGLAPYLQAAADKFTELSVAGGGLGPKVGGALEWVATAVATAADYVQLLPIAFYGFRAGALESIASVLGAIDWLGSGLVKLMNLLPGVKVEWTDTFSVLKAGMEQVAGEEAGKMNDALGKFQRGDNAAKVAKVFDDIKLKSGTAAQATADNAAKMHGAFNNIEDGAANLKKVADTLGDLQKQVEQFGLNDAQKKLADLKSNGASGEQQVQAQGLLALKEQFESIAKISTDDPLADFASKMERLQQLYAQGKVTADQFAAIREGAKTAMNDKLADSAKSITDSVKSPLEKYQEEVAKLNELFERGLITQDVFDKASLKAKTGLESAGEKSQPAAVSAVHAGSAEAMKLAFESSKGSQVVTKDQVQQAQLKQQQTSNQYLELIMRNTRDAVSGPAIQEVGI